MGLDILQLISKYLHVSDLARLCSAAQGTAWPEQFEDRQRLLARQMEANVEPGDNWGWIFPPPEQCFDTCQIREGTIVRFITRRAGWSVFRGEDSFDLFDAARHDTFLIHDDDLRILWVGSGTNVNGCWLSGIEMEERAIAGL